MFQNTGMPVGFTLDKWGPTGPDGARRGPTGPDGASDQKVKRNIEKNISTLQVGPYTQIRRKTTITSEAILKILHILRGGALSKLNEVSSSAGSVLH